MAFISKAEQYAKFDDITVTDFAEDKAPKIQKFSCSKSGEGYNWILIRNGERDATVIEEVNFPKFEGLTLVAPEKGSSYKMEVGPGKMEIVMMKGELSGYSMRMTYTS